jgi:predicted Zn-dependent peptidase
VPDASLHVTTYPRLGERLYSARLPVGLAVYVLPRPGYAKKYATFATRYGSVDNRFREPGGSVLEVPDGIAHFLEHQMFAQEYGDAFERFAELGASANAFTSYTNTTYLFSCTDRFDDAFRLLLDFVQEPHFTDAGTEKERGIIQQEIRMYDDNPSWRLRQGLHQCLYQVHPFRIDIAGTVESVGRITTDLLRRCYATFYHPANMVVSVVGDVDPEGVVALVEDRIAAHGHRTREPVERLLPAEPPEVASRSFEARMAVARPLLAVGFKERQVGVAGRQRLERDLATDLLLEVLFGPASDNYDAWYQAGLVDRTFAAGYYGEDAFGLSRIGGETDRPGELQEAIMAAVRRARSRGIPAADFRRVQNKAIGGFVSQFNSPEALAYLLNEAHFAGVRPFDYLEVLESLTPDHLERRLAEHLDPDYAAVAVVLPHGRA